MKAVIINNDFRVYWKGRLTFLRQYLSAGEIDFYAVELFGKGSPYSFDAYNNTERWWTCLFPNMGPAEIKDRDIQKALFYALDEINPDIIIAPSIVFYAGALGIRWVKKNNKKFIMFDDATAGQVKRMFIVQWVKDLIIKQADGFWLPSPDYYNSYAYLGKRGIHFFYGFNSIDNTHFKAAGNNEMNHNTIICVARLVPVKNIDSLLKAWAFAEKTAPWYRLIIIGKGPAYDTLTALRLQLNLNNVDFLGVISNDRLADYYHRADAFILPSLSESWGLVVNEAMAAGLPVLLSHNVNAAKFLLKEGINGYGFNPQSVTNMTDAILKFINLDIGAKKLMSAKSLEIIDLMSYEKMGLQLREALMIIKSQKTKKPGLLAAAIIKAWNGRYNTAGWDK